MNLKRISILAISLLLFSTNVVSANNDNWTDFSKRFLTNTDFNQGNSDGWTIESNAGQKAVSANLMRFWNGTFDFYQELPRLPKGHYRLTVQGFYRSQGDSYSLYKNGTEQLKAFLYAGEASTPLMSVYSQAMTSTAGTRQQHDGKYYPDNSTSAAAAFDEGLYTGNSVEFDAEGSITIGVRCQEAGTNNYCAFDNFKLEYASPIGPDGKSSMPVRRPPITTVWNSGTAHSISHSSSRTVLRANTASACRLSTAVRTTRPTGEATIPTTGMAHRTSRLICMVPMMPSR